MACWGRGLAAATLFIGSVARADDASQARDKAFAEALFQEARTLLDQGKIPEACTKLAASQHLEPKLGTLLNLATCHESEGKTASAWAEFVEALAQAERSKQVERVDFAKLHVEALEGQLSRVVLAFAKPPADAVVRIDGVVIERTVIGTLLPLDPGEHAIAVSASGKRTWTSTLVVARGPSEAHVDLPALEDEPKIATTNVLVVPDPPPARVETRSRFASVPGWIAVGMGALALGVGTYAGVRAFALNSDGERQCTGNACPQGALDTIDDARTHATVSTILIGVGVVALATAAYFFFLDPPKKQQVAR